MSKNPHANINPTPTTPPSHPTKPDKLNKTIMNNNARKNSTTKRVALIQMSCAPDTQLNLDKAAERVYEAARLGAHIVCLPELFRAQYFCQREDHALFGLAEPIPVPPPTPSPASAAKPASSS